jgi:hypothetical protein
MQLVAAIARHERRVRLLFDEALPPASLGNLALYRITAEDALGIAMPIVGLAVIAGQPHAIELALGADLVEGVLYAVHTAGAKLPIRLGAKVAQVDTERDGEDVAESLFGVDCGWANGDYAETPGGDLATVGGEDNVVGALERRLQSDGLLWDDDYGSKPRQYIDGAMAAAGALKGALVRQARADDRVRRANATLRTADADAFFDVAVELLGGRGPLRIAVPLKGS